MGNKFKTKTFWISLAGMIIMLLQLLGVKIDAPYVNEVVNAVCAICVFVGLLSGDSSPENIENQQETGENQQETDEKTE
ncbi:MAG: hypothetical protein IKC35_01630 [Clostridia bacterium]|nr:hypothetical protein [Clostridia bacterium]